MTSFDLSSPRRLLFGSGRLRELPDLIGPRRLLLVTGSRSFTGSSAFDTLGRALAAAGTPFIHATVAGEPTPAMIDQLTQTGRKEKVEAVAAIGGGSVLDAGKAVSAMLPQAGSVKDYLEGVGSCQHDGRKLFFAAVPTTSGTGSEATKNAVISSPGPGGFKKSLRHDNLIPDFALVDPALTLSCPYEVTAACGMDALTQLIEAYVSPKASPLTDALCQRGLTGFGQALIQVLEETPQDLGARSILSLGSYLSGVALANAGLGTVHGFASVIGGLATNRHGQVCGTLVAETTRATVELLQGSTPDHPALEKYAQISQSLGLCLPGHSIAQSCHRLIDALAQWTERFRMPRLAACGVTRSDLEVIARKTNQKNNPAPLPPRALERILETRI